MLFKEKFISRVRIPNVEEINISADELVKKLLRLSETETVCLLDSCGVNHLGSHLLIAGIKPLEMAEFTNKNTEKTLKTFNQKLSKNIASIFTISYNFGLKLENINLRKKEISNFPEPDIFLANFDCLIIHDYNTGETYLDGNPKKFAEIKNFIINLNKFIDSPNSAKSKIKSNFTKAEYIAKIRKIQEYIRRGETYQTNLTQQFRAELPKDLTPQQIFWNLRKNHPAPFASFIKRKNDYVVSISLERFFEVESGFSQIIKTSPIKGTRPRGQTLTEDLRLKNELISSKKDRAENTMIVDLLRNDIGKICEFGSVEVEKLCDLETHPSLFHLVSTVSGKLKKDMDYAEIIKALFPCGSITGCPKIRTMQIIDELETANRGLSMGAIGYSISNSKSKIQNPKSNETLHSSVAIRTMVIRGREAIFNVGGGIVIDSIAEDEYLESLVKAKAILEAIGVK
ncbi:MAG: aminodeoxychorismate synthase component I [Acidobacteriota bacterium]|nr:aminodeoxychorismate synthase component I [Acidobacteriota bacterium]